MKSVNIRINGINAQFLAAKDLLAIAASKLEAEEDKNKKEQEILNESGEIFFEIAAKAKWINGLISTMKGCPRDIANLCGDSPCLCRPPS
ncbi:hypothetical protein FACS189496_1660 [Bacilli bacterium]|nr:hypothetical protein FACS189496_1660 [Bacilli bacterium]